jgi:hypothetical protein
MTMWMGVPVRRRVPAGIVCRSTRPFATLRLCAAVAAMPQWCRFAAALAALSVSPMRRGTTQGGGSGFGGGVGCVVVVVGVVVVGVVAVVVEGGGGAGDGAVVVVPDGAIT